MNNSSVLEAKKRAEAQARIDWRESRESILSQILEKWCEDVVPFLSNTDKEFRFDILDRSRGFQFSHKNLRSYDIMWHSGKTVQKEFLRDLYERIERRYPLKWSHHLDVYQDTGYIDITLVSRILPEHLSFLERLKNLLRSA